MGPRAAVAAALLAVAAGLAGAAADALSVLSLKVRFGSAAAVDLAGDLTSDRLPAYAFDETVHRFRVEVGGVLLVDTFEDAPGLRLRRDGWGDLVGRGRRLPDGRSVRFRLAPGSGRFQVRARGLDADLLRAAGPEGLAVRAVVGAADASESLFPTVRPRAWTYRRDVPLGGGGPITGGGSGGGGPPPGSPPPPPATAPIVVVPVAEGLGSATPASTFVVCRSQAQLQAMWSAHAPGGTAPTVDFTKEIVVGWFAGPTSIWHEAKITWGERLNGGLQVHLYLKGTSGGSFPGAFSIVRVTRVDGPVTVKAHWTITGI